MLRFVPSSPNASILRCVSELLLDEPDRLRSSEELDDDESFDEEEGSSPPSGDRCILFLDRRLESFDRRLDLLFFPFFFLWTLLFVLSPKRRK
jgi:hypothetical protein